ncbi:tail fiber protein [Synechococcus phage Bellamy]|uniref:Putative tail fiber n=1 Tax=Synechococcus phage Bellamy TaxID=2023996 RepID=A0A222YXG5_9CAUD|nr:tail fiber protein [Synechococcus phage Bellamy]ASR76166.1 putative tail fiber [Synechococcus phage Bellamy]
MSTELGEFFSLIGKARQEKEEEFQSLVGEINIDSLFAEVKTSVAEDKKKKKKKLEEDKKKKAKEKKQVKALESWLYSEPKQEEKLEIEDANGDVAFEVVDLITPEPLKPSEPVVEEQEKPEEISEEAEEIPEDTVDHALKILETIKSKEEVQENVSDPEIIKIRRELEYLKNLVNAQGGGGEVRLEFLDDVDRDTALVDGKFLKYQASTKTFVGADASGGGGSTAGIDTTGTSHFKNLSLTGITTGLNVSGIATVGRLASFKALVGAASSTTETFVTTVDSKTTNHRYYGSGSSSAYFLDGIESPFLTLLPGKTYRFDQSDSSNGGHPLRFYLEADKTTAYTTNVTTNGTAGSSGAYTEILVTDSTPLVLHYQCSSHGYMGNSSFLNSNLVDTPYQITARSGINVSGIVTATSFVGNITGNVTGNADTATSATTATTATNAQGLTGTPNITVGIITAASAEFSGNVTVGGTITYEDVKNVDSLGIVTARTGIDVLANGINVVGISTISTGVGTVHVGTGNTTLLVDGDARVTGILTIGTESITLDPTAKQIRGLEEIIIGIANTITIKQDSKGEIEFTDAAGTQKSVGIGTTVSINTSGIITATSFVGDVTGDVTGNADTATLATTATYAVNAGLATEATYAITAGLATEATYAVTAGLATEATFALTAGISTFATTAGVATDVIGGIASVTTLDVTGVSTLPAISGQNINVSGIVTANAFVGDGTGLTGVGGGSVISGITIREEGSTVGTAGTVVSLNFVGDNITATSSGAAATITASATPTFDSVSVGVATVSSALYVPKYTTTARDAATFAEGAIIFNTTTKKMNFYDGTNWVELPGVTLGLGMGVF